MLVVHGASYNADVYEMPVLHTKLTSGEEAQLR